jgi:two-component system cell cycle sensor histidine kinase/response regulator CckA
MNCRSIRSNWNEELRESRAQLELSLGRYTDLYDFAPVAYFTLSASGIINAVNLPGASLLGLERARLVDLNFTTFVAKGSRPIFDAWLKKVFSSDIKQHGEVVLERGGLPRSVELDASISNDGKEALVVAADVTSKKELEEQLRQSQKMEVVGQLAGGVAHDFNNIVAAMILNLEMLQLKVVLPSEAQSPVENLMGLAKRSASLTRQLLFFSRRQAMVPVLMEVNGAVTALLKMLERVLGEQITYVFEPGSPEYWVKADPAMLDQALMNLCLNARDAMPQGGTLTLTTSICDFDSEYVIVHPDAQTGEFVRIRVSDTGCGMDAEVLKHVFEPFFTTKEVGQGTGLGLASSHGIAEQHNGWMSVESIVGEGTHFDLYLPWVARPDPIQATTNPVVPHHGKKQTVLVVEDEEALLTIFTKALSMFGYRVFAAANGPEALKVWEENHEQIQLVLTDMRMPKGMSGLDLAKKMWQLKPLLKVIIMSGYSLEITRDANVGSSAYVFLPKPFDLTTLSETVSECLR